MGGVGALLCDLGTDDLDIPQIAVVGVPDDSNPSLALPSPSLDSSHLPPSPLPSDIHGFLSPQPPFGGPRGIPKIPWVLHHILLVVPRCHLPLPLLSLPACLVRFVGQIQPHYATITPRKTMDRLTLLRPRMTIAERAA